MIYISCCTINYRNKGKEFYNKHSTTTPFLLFGRFKSMQLDL